jgi:hypothetical protein
MLPGAWKTQLTHRLHGVEGFRLKRGTVTECPQDSFRQLTPQASKHLRRYAGTQE